jgi:hypothetical protein
MAEKKDPSILDMARDVETLIHPVARSVTILVIQLHIVLIAMQSLLTLPMLLKLSIPALHLTLQPIGILILELLHILRQTPLNWTRLNHIMVRIM